MAPAAVLTKSPKFYYGPVKRDSKTGDGQGFQLSLVDLEIGIFRWFDYASDLRRAIEMLIAPAGSEREEHQNVDLPAKRVSTEVPAEDLEDLFGEQEWLAEIGREDLAMSLCDPLMIKKDRLRDLHRMEIDHLFREHQAQQRLLDGRAKRPQGSHKIRARILQRELNCAKALTGRSQEAYELRDFDELEPADMWHGPFYSEADFTDDLNCVPAHLQGQYKFLDLKQLVERSESIMAQAQVIWTEVTLAFHPEMAEKMTKARGHTGLTSVRSTDTDVMMEDIKARR